MKKNLLSTAAILTLALASPAIPSFAATNSNDKTMLEKGWDETKETAKDVGDGISSATKEAYESIKARIYDKNTNPKLSAIQIDPRMTAGGMIGEPVYDVSGERIAKIHDIIFDNSGTADLVILADGDFTGLGKLAAFKYSALVMQKKEGTFISPLTEEMIDQAIAFSYDQNDESDNTQTMPDHSFSANDLLGTDVKDPEGKTLATAENIVLQGGHIQNVLLRFNDILGLGGDQVAVPYETFTLSHQKDVLELHLDAQQAAEFRAFKEIASN